MQYFEIFCELVLEIVALNFVSLKQYFVESFSKHEILGRMHFTATCRLIPGKGRSSNARSVRDSLNLWPDCGSTKKFTWTSSVLGHSAVFTVIKPLKGEYNYV